jgi:hypothetical protein
MEVVLHLVQHQMIPTRYTSNISDGRRKFYAIGCSLNCNETYNSFKLHVRTLIHSRNPKGSWIQNRIIIFLIYIWTWAVRNGQFVWRSPNVVVSTEVDVSRRNSERKPVTTGDVAINPLCRLEAVAMSIYWLQGILTRMSWNRQFSFKISYN